MSIIYKFSAFCVAKTTMAIVPELKVLKTALMSSLLYSSESWMILSVWCMETQNNKLVQIILGVRCNKSIHLCNE